MSSMTSNVSQFVARARQLEAAGKAGDAENLLRWSLSLAPADAEANRALGMLLMKRGRPDQGADCLRRAADAAQVRPELWYELGMCLAVSERYAESAAALERSLGLAPQALQIYELLGQVLFRADELRKSCDIIARGLSLDPKNTFLGQGYVTALKACGKVSEAGRVAAQLADEHPDDPELLALAAWQATYWDQGDPLHIRAWLERRGALLARGAAPVTFTQSTDPERRLRVGFLCQDIRRDSPIARFIDAVLVHLDRERFDLWGYCTQSTLQHMSARLLGAVGGGGRGWMDVSSFEDPALLDRIRADQIDILVETAGNTPGHRQPALARRAAPVQVTCIGDPRTTGNPAIDYRIVDEITDPRGTPGAEQFCTERLARVPGCFLCYEPHEDAPPARPPRDAALGPITFGSLNVHDKTGPGVIDVWCRIMHQVEGSRILIKSLGMRSRDVREHFLGMFSERGIEAARVELAWEVPAMSDHLMYLHKVDIALDTFPYNGTTTTCDALWMGVPVVTLLGSWHAARVGASLLTSVGLPELIAADADEYVRIAAALAQDHARLADLQRTLRDRMNASPLRDAKDYARRVGDAYRAMWRAWCGRSIGG